MIDYLAIRVPQTASPTPFFSDIYSSTRTNHKIWRGGQFYQASANLQEFGVDAIVHMDCKMTKRNMHKVEVIRAGDKSFEEILEIPRRLFSGELLNFGVMRVDLTADVHGVGMDWFKRHTQFRHKQTAREFGVFEPYHNLRKSKAETIYAGQRPNVFRMYDKTAERRYQYRKLLKDFGRVSRELSDQSSYDLRHGAGDSIGALPEPPTFESLYGTADDALVTRVERQIATRDITRLGLPTLGSLYRLQTLDPFKNMIFYDESPSMEPHPDLSSDAYCAGMMWRARVKEYGLNETLACMKAAHGKNFHRAKKKFDSFLRITEKVVGIDSKQLAVLFHGSIGRQMYNRAA